MEGVVMGEGVGKILCARKGARSQEKTMNKWRMRGVFPCNKGGSSWFSVKSGVMHVRHLSDRSLHSVVRVINLP